MPKCCQCEHSRWNPLVFDLDCVHPNNSDPVFAVTPCRIERGLNGMCQPVGYNFYKKKPEPVKPKKRWWQWL
jgi:hypothetical protein